LHKAFCGIVCEEKKTPAQALKLKSLDQNAAFANNALMESTNIYIASILVVISLLGLPGCALVRAPRLDQYPLTTNEILEASGLAASQKTPGILYTHNDSGGEATVYVLNCKGMLAAHIRLEGANNQDWEDIAVAPHGKEKKSHIFVADIGDNNARRSLVSVYRFAEPALTDTLIRVKNYDHILIQYEDGARDAEALFVDPLNGDIYIISKREENVGLYRVAYPYSLQDINIATKEMTLPLSYVTAADISPNGRKILIKTYTSIYEYKRKKNQSVVKALSGKSKQLPYYLEPQGEAVAWDAKAKSYFTLSESVNDQPPILYHYR
jgi:hypothetical protein